MKRIPFVNVCSTYIVCVICNVYNVRSSRNVYDAYNVHIACIVYAVHNASYWMNQGHAKHGPRSSMYICIYKGPFRRPLISGCCLTDWLAAFLGLILVFHPLDLHFCDVVALVVALGLHFGVLGLFPMVFCTIGTGHGTPYSSTWNSHRGGSTALLGARLEGHGIQDPSKVQGRSFSWAVPVAIRQVPSTWELVSSYQ